ncbi:MAG: hypothetical protein R8G34_02815 [Paracoccaceae bacterium]|nr:hypothetical protein [Paracoccaceae bacterium]
MSDIALSSVDVSVDGAKTADQSISTRDALDKGVSKSGPFQFLDYFKEKDSAKFAGREQEITDIVEQITRARTTILYGKSGLGKTSLLQAGVLPEMRKRRFTPIYVRTLQAPLDDFIVTVDHAVADHLTDPDAISEAKGDLVKGFIALNEAKGPVVVFFDQFEEFFIRFKEKRAERKLFIDAVIGIAKNTSIDVRVVFSLREDYLAALDDFRFGLPNLFSNANRLMPLTAFGARQAILAPLLAEEVPFDRSIIANIVDGLEVHNFDPPLLQILCTEVYRVAFQRDGEEAALKSSDVDAVGSIDDIFESYIQRLLDQTPQNLHFLVKLVLNKLITSDNTKMALRAEDLTHGNFVITLPQCQEVLKFLVAGKIVRCDTRQGTDWFELVHEHIVDFIQRWLNDDPDFFDFRQTIGHIENGVRASDWDERIDRLLPGGLLEDYVYRFRKQLRLEPDVQKFIVRSCIAARQSSQLSFWCHRVGEEESKAIIEDMMKSDEAAARAAAAEMASTVIEGHGLAGLHLEKALTDEDEDVRRNNGAAFAKVATKAELISLRQALNAHATRARALDILADVYGHARY